VGLREDLERIAASAAGFAADGERMAGVVPARAEPDERTYLCAFDRGEERTWLVLDDAGAAETNREVVRRTASIIALCELAEERAGGGDLQELREQLVALRLTENPPGIEEAEEAALDLERAIGSPPRLAEPAFLDRVGAAARLLELALGPSAASPFAGAMKQGMAAVDEFVRDVESNYRATLD
jgi:hypothetical protein